MRACGFPFRLPNRYGRQRSSLESHPMLRAITPPGDPNLVQIDAASGVLPEHAIWIDMINPTREEELFVEATTGVAVPSLADMDEIEVSSRLYEENGAIYMTATIATGILRESPETHSVSFILTPRHLITVRYAEIQSFDRFANHSDRTPALWKRVSALKKQRNWQ